MPFKISNLQQELYQQDGFVVLPRLFDAEEIKLLKRAMEEDPAIAEHSLIRPDQEGFGTRNSLWNRAGNSV